nr:tRNA1(Val) (adenine(37)-N6)-methyltransferase [uncultured Blautia sp.]
MENKLHAGLVRQGERVDDLQNGYYVIQNPEKFCFGMDAVLLSGFAKIKKGQRVLDMGTGTGIIPVLLRAKTPGEHFTGLEIQEECAEMARRSVTYNNLEQDIDIVCGDIKEAAEIFGAASFHAVTCNPPYMIGQHGLQNPYMPKAIARHEILCTLEDVVSQASRVLKDRGHFYIVHRPFRLAEIFQVLTKYKLEPKRMQLVYPFADREPNMVLIEALKGGNSRITVERPLIVYEKPGVYTEDILRIYGPSGA